MPTPVLFSDNSHTDENNNKRKIYGLIDARVLIRFLWKSLERCEKNQSVNIIKTTCRDSYIYKAKILHRNTDTDKQKSTNNFHQYSKRITHLYVNTRLLYKPDGKINKLLLTDDTDKNGI